MGKTTTGTNPYQGLFDQNSEEALKILKPDSTVGETDLNGIREPFPTIDGQEPADESEMTSFWKKLRSFYAGNETDTSESVAGLLPAAFSPFVGKQHVEESYPLFVSETQHGTLSELINSIAQFQASNSHFSLLERFLPTIIHNVRAFVDFKEPTPIQEAITAGFQSFRDQIELGKDERKYLMLMLGELERNTPNDGVLIPFGLQTPYHLLNGVLSHKGESKMELITKAKLLLSDLEGLHTSEKISRNGGASHSDDSLRFAESLVDLDALAAVTPESTTEPMDDARFSRNRKHHC